MKKEKQDNKQEKKLILATEEEKENILGKEYYNKAKEYNIPREFLEKHTETIKLILNSFSLKTHEEKQHWFNLYSDMNEEALEKLKDILTREKQKLKKIRTKSGIFYIIIAILLLCFSYINISNTPISETAPIKMLKNLTQEATIEYASDELKQEVLSGYYEESKEYNIPKDMLVKNTELVELILGSISLETKENKQERFDLYKDMNQTQINDLTDILTREKQKLKEIEDKYNKILNNTGEINN